MMFLAMLLDVLNIVSRLFCLSILLISLFDKYLVLLLSFMFRYTPVSDPDSKGYFDLLIKVHC